MPIDLTGDTIDPTRPPERGCYGCPRENHERSPGVAGLSDEPLVHSGQKDQGSALLGRPAHRRGRG